LPDGGHGDLIADLDCLHAALRGLGETLQAA
jgi:hypothetical protein